MGLFDIFKKSKNESSFPENELEKCLMQIGSGASAQKAFYKKLLWSPLFVMSAGSKQSETTEHVTVKFIALENGQIPVFTSYKRIFDNGVITKDVKAVSLKGQDLFNFAKGTTFVINPYSKYWKELTPREIEDIMNGTIYDKLDALEEESKNAEAFNEIFDQASKKQQGLVLLGDYRAKSLTSSEKSRLEESVNGFEKCLEMFPDHWQSMVLMAKSLQRLERHKEALEQLEKAFEIEQANHIIPMEAALEAMHLQDIDKALFYSGESLQRKPGDYALMGNHAMNLLVGKKDAEAKTIIAKAIKIEPNDPVNKNIAALVADVISGKRKRPTFEDTIR